MFDLGRGGRGPLQSEDIFVYFEAVAAKLLLLVLRASHEHIFVLLRELLFLSGPAEPARHLYHAFKIDLLFDCPVLGFALNCGNCLAFNVLPVDNFALLDLLSELTIMYFALHLVEVVKDLLLSFLACYVEFNHVVKLLRLPFSALRRLHRIQSVLDVDAGESDCLMSDREHLD